MTRVPSIDLVQTLREFCAAVYGAQCLAARGELGPRVWALMRYAGTLLDAIDIRLLEDGLPPAASELAAAGRLRERFERLVLVLLTYSLRDRARAGDRRSRRQPRQPAAPHWHAMSVT